MLNLNVGQSILVSIVGFVKLHALNTGHTQWLLRMFIVLC
jgi:hypothetical protein